MPYSHFEEGTRETTARTLRLFSDRLSPPVEATEEGPRRRLDHREHRGMGHRETHRPPVSDGAAGRGHGARRPELGLARLRDAGWFLAPPRRADQAQDPRHHGDQR